MTSCKTDLIQVARAGKYKIRSYTIGVQDDTPEIEEQISCNLQNDVSTRVGTKMHGNTNDKADIPGLFIVKAEGSREWYQNKD